MAAPQFQVLLAWTRTGQVIDGLDQPGWSAEENLEWGQLGKGDITMPLPGLDRAGRVVRSTLRAIASAGSSLSVAVVRDQSTVLFAGPVTSVGWDDAGVTVGAASLGWVFDRRIVCANGFWADPTAAGADLTLELGPRDRAIALLSAATTGPGRDLPLTLPALSGDSGTPVTYLGADVRTTFEAVKDITEADGGPDVMLVPQLSADQSLLSWTAAVGAPALGADNPDAVWDFPLVALSGDLDDSETVSTAYVLGDQNRSGTGAADGAAVSRPIGVWSVDRGSPWIALERADRTSVSETRPEQLDALATSYGQAYAYAVEAVDVSAPSDAGPQFRTQYNLGDGARFPVSGHPWLDDAELSRRIIGVKLDADSTALTTTGGRVTLGGL